MSTVQEKVDSIQGIASQIHSGSPAASVSEGFAKKLIEEKVTSVAAPATTYAFTHTETETIRLSGLTGATTINLTAGADLAIGSDLIIEVTQDGTGRDLVFGTGITADTLTGVANDVDVVILKYVAVDTWILISNVKSVNAA